MIGNALLILCNSSNDNSLSVTKPSPFAEVVNAEIPVCATKVKKERVAKSRKAKTDDPSQNKLMFPSAVAGTEGIVKKEIIPVQTALNFPTEKRKRAVKRPAPVAYSKRPTKIIKYYFSSDEDD